MVGVNYPVVRVPPDLALIKYAVPRSARPAHPGSLPRKWTWWPAVVAGVGLVFLLAGQFRLGALVVVGAAVALGVYRFTYLARQQLHRVRLRAYEDWRPPDVNQYRIQKLQEYLNRVERPAGRNGQVQRGRSEDGFAQVLEQFFPGQVQPSAFLEIPGFPHPYTTDFTLEVDGLHIDIEIDEPYAWTTKEPHHCVDDSRDERRDRFFMERGWVVIRFSEKQVMKEPAACCGVIAQTIARVRGRPVPDWVAGVGTLQEDPRWTTEQARIYAQQDYRRGY